MFDTIFQQCLIHCCLALCVTTLGRLICETGCCLHCFKQKPYHVFNERTLDPFKRLIHIRNKSKKKIRRLTIQLHNANLGFRLRPSNAKSSEGMGTIIESKGSYWHKVEVKPRKIFTFELDCVQQQRNIEKKVRCIVSYVNKNCEDQDVEAVATVDRTGLRISNFT